MQRSLLKIKTQGMEKSQFWSMRQKIIFLLCSVIIGLLICEVALRVFRVKINNGIPRYYCVYDNSAGVDICKNFPATIYGHSYFKLKVWSNELGCFDRPYLGERDYILLIGDSFAWGCAPFDSLYSTLLEKFLNYRVLKAGVPGYGTKQEYFKMKKTVESIKNKPKLVILSYYLVNDLQDDYLFPNQRMVIDGYMVAKTVLKDATTGEKEIYDDSLLREQVQNCRIFNNKRRPKGMAAKIKRLLLVNSAVYQVMRDSTICRKMAAKCGLLNTPSPEAPAMLSYIPINKYPWLSKVWDKHLLNLKAIKALSDEYGARLLVVIFPAKEQIYDFLRTKDMDDYDWEQPNRILKNFFDEESIESVDLTPYFLDFADKKLKTYLDLKNGLYWQFDSHMSIRGHRLSYLLIARHLLKNKFIDIPHSTEKVIEIERRLINFKLDD